MASPKNNLNFFRLDNLNFSDCLNRETRIIIKQIETHDNGVYVQSI